MVNKVLFAAGGTGGHVFPAIAVADAMKSVNPNLEIAFVGAAHGNEKNWVENAGYRFILLDIDFIKGASIGRKIKNMLSLPGCAKKASAILKEEKPDLVIGSGGYVSGPLVFMATRHKIPTAIMEQNAIPGLTNRILCHFVDKIYTSFENTTKLPQDKVVFTGNPVRAAVLSNISSGNKGEIKPLCEVSCINTPLTDNPLHILVFGGSQGAMKLNTDVPIALSKLPEETRKNIAVFHQTGKGKLEETKKSYTDCGIHAETSEFIDDMGSAYAWADLLVCRSGASSLAEIKAAGKASILVPFPFAAHNHQEKNADAMVNIGAAIKILNDDVASKLPEVLADLMQNRDKIEKMAKAALDDAKPDAALDIARKYLSSPEKTSSEKSSTEESPSDNV